MLNYVFQNLSKGEIMNFDLIDRKILEHLQKNALLSGAELAELAGASPTSCWRRVKALEAAGVLGPAVRLLDPELLGCNVNVFCNIRVKSHAREARGNFEDFVRTRKEILECHSMSGEWDYLLRIVVRDVAEYERLLMRELLGHPTVGGASSHFALSQKKFTTELPI
jgi:Lrp/AsnC family transcriptional regulator